jgi:hypothetical protein
MTKFGVGFEVLMAVTEDYSALKCGALVVWEVCTNISHEILAPIFRLENVILP